MGPMAERVDGATSDVDSESQSPECERVCGKPPRITGLGDVLALGAISLGGSVGVVLSPVLAAAHLVKKRRERRRAEAARLLAASAPPGSECRDGHWGACAVRRPPGAKPGLPEGCRRQAAYVRMSDGVGIAVDILLPPGVSFDGSGTHPPVPCVLHCARYWRAWEVRWPMRGFVNGGEPWDFGMGEIKSELLLAGFAVVSADVRGSGASEGTMDFVWSERETQDTLELVDFIAGGRGRAAGSPGRPQPWSDGRVALFGISYDAGAAVRAAARGHPALKAVVSSYLFGDVWRELFPGGIMNRWFLHEWCNVNRRLDNARLGSLHPMAPIFVKGAAPAGPRRRHNKAVAAHAANWDLMSHANRLRFMDDPVDLECGLKVDIRILDLWSKHVSECRLREEGEDETSTVMAALGASGVPVMIISGWSCVTASTACSLFAAHGGPGWRLLLGPWNHGATQHVRYRHGTRPKQFPLAAEVADFFLKHMPLVVGEESVPSESAAPEPEPVRCYVDGDRPSWLASTSWPPQQLRKQPLWLLPGGGLAWDGPGAQGDSQPTTPLPQPAGTGSTPLWAGVTRYNAMIKMLDFVSSSWQLPAEAEAGRLLRFETPPLEAPAALLGAGVLSLRLRGAGASEQPAAADADVFAYLCEQHEGGGPPAYVTEGQLRLSCRAELRPPRHAAAADPPPAEGAPAAGGGGGDGAVPFHSFLRRDEAQLPRGEEGFTARLALLPTGHRFSKGSRIQLLLAADDPVHFSPNPSAAGRPPRLCLAGLEASLLWLPLLREA